MEKPNLMWEIIRFFPQILYTIEPTEKRLRKALCHDMSHFHYFLESEFGCTEVRDSDFTSCKSLLQSQLVHPSLFFYFTRNLMNLGGIVPHLKSFD